MTFTSADGWWGRGGSQEYGPEQSGFEVPGIPVWQEHWELQTHHPTCWLGSCIQP